MEVTSGYEMIKTNTYNAYFYRNRVSF